MLITSHVLFYLCKYLCNRCLVSDIFVSFWWWHPVILVVARREVVTGFCIPWTRLLPPFSVMDSKPVSEVASQYRCRERRLSNLPYVMSVVCSCLFAGLTAARINLIFCIHILIWSDCAIGYMILTFEVIKGHFRSNKFLCKVPLSLWPEHGCHLFLYGQSMGAIALLFENPGAVALL